MSVYKLVEPDMTAHRSAPFVDVVDDMGDPIRFKSPSDAREWARDNRPGVAVIVEPIHDKARDSFALFAR